jgi:V8-like Glu-specific endopeptidase
VDIQETVDRSQLEDIQISTAALNYQPMNFLNPLDQIYSAPEESPVASVGFGTPAAAQIINSAAVPWSTVVLVEAIFPNGLKEYGSGVMIGRNDVATAAHVVYRPQDGGYAQSVSVTPAYNPATDSGPYGSWPALLNPAFVRNPWLGSSGTLRSDGLIQNGNGGEGFVGSELDFALLTLRNSLGDRTGWMLLDPRVHQGDSSTLYETGYTQHYGFQMTNDLANARFSSIDSFIDITNFETWPGNSGGPLWYRGADNNLYVTGLVSSATSGQGSAAFEILPWRNFIQAWIAANDSVMV